MMNQKKFKFIQPRFGILRNLSNAQAKNLVANEEYKELWKHDEYIHAMQFEKNLISVSDIITPIPPKTPTFIDGLFNKKSSEIYEKKLSIYNDEYAEYTNKIEKINKQNDLISLYKQIKEKQKHTCHFCNFIDPLFIEIHHVNGDHFDNSEKNLVTACTLCHRQHHLLWLSVHDHAQLGAVNADYINQAELNHLQRICLVFNNEESGLEPILGRSGKLGHMLEQLSSGFSRPLHAFMMPEAEKLKIKNEYLSKVKLRYPPTGKEENFEVISRALDALDATLPSQVQLQEIGKLDTMIGVAELKKNEPNSTEEQLRFQSLSAVREAMVKYERDYETTFELNFMNKTDTFSLFELAMSLKSISVEDYKAFNPPNLYLIFKDGIFSEEQIAAYRKMDYFQTEKWSFGDN